MIKVKHKGNFKNTERLFERAKNLNVHMILSRYAEVGLLALRDATPKESGKTARSWDYEIVPTKNGAAIYWSNRNVNDGVNIAVILQYGHGTRNGGYVQGIDYINPAIAPVFEGIADQAWKEVNGI